MLNVYEPGQLVGTVLDTYQLITPVLVLRLLEYNVLDPQGPLSDQVKRAVLALPVVLETLPTQRMPSPALKEVLALPLPSVVKAEVTVTLPLLLPLTVYPTDLEEVEPL